MTGPRVVGGGNRRFSQSHFDRTGHGLVASIPILGEREEHRDANVVHDDGVVLLAAPEIASKPIIVRFIDYHPTTPGPIRGGKAKLPLEESLFLFLYLHSEINY